MKRPTLYVYGLTIAFALLGLWAGKVMGGNQGWIALLGGSVGWALGIGFARVPAPRS